VSCRRASCARSRRRPSARTVTDSIPRSWRSWKDAAASAPRTVSASTRRCTGRGSSTSCATTSRPRVAAVLGGDRFTALAGAYLERHPSTDPSVRWVGAYFAAFLAERGRVDEQPFLTDLARLEWTRLAVFDAADAVPLRLEALRAIPPSKWPRLTFHPVPALRVLRCAWPVHELWAADDPKAAATTVRPAATVLRVWREAFAVYQTPVDAVEHVALRQLLAGAPFGVMCDRLEAVLPPPAVAREAGALILRWVEDQILALPLAPSRRGRAR